MNFDDLKHGQHAWVELDNQLLIVIKIGNYFYDCGPWENGVNPKSCTIIELIEKPKSHEAIALYYADFIGDITNEKEI